MVIENVRGLLTSPAGSPGDLELCPWCLGDTAGQPPVRALGAVLGSLADIVPGANVLGFVNAQGVANTVWVYLP